MGYLLCIIFISFFVCLLNNYCSDIPMLYNNKNGHEFSINEPDVNDYITTNQLKYYKDDLRKFITYEERLENAKRLCDQISENWLFRCIFYIIMLSSLSYAVIKIIKNLSVSLPVFVVVAIAFLSAIILIVILSVLAKLIYRKHKLPNFERTEDEIKEEFAEHLCRIAYSKYCEGKTPKPSVSKFELDYKNNESYYLSIIYETTLEAAVCFKAIEYTIKKIRIHDSYLNHIINSLHRRYFVSKVYAWVAFILYLATFGLPNIL